jgi:hypothetical protein
VPTKIFIGYAQSDAKWLAVVRSFLFPANSVATKLDIRDFEDIAPQTVWSAELEAAITGSLYSLLLVSQNFLDSKFVWSQAIPNMVKLAGQGHRTFWLPISASRVGETDLGKLQALWTPGEPLALLARPKREKALCEIAEAVDRFAKTNL